MIVAGKITLTLPIAAQVVGGLDVFAGEIVVLENGTERPATAAEIRTFAPSSRVIVGRKLVESILLG